MPAWPLVLANLWQRLRVRGCWPGRPRPRKPICPRYVQDMSKICRMLWPGCMAGVYGWGYVANMPRICSSYVEDTSLDSVEVMSKICWGYGRGYRWGLGLVLCQWHVTDMVEVYGWGYVQNMFKSWPRLLLRLRPELCRRHVIDSVWGCGWGCVLVMLLVEAMGMLRICHRCVLVLSKLCCKFWSGSWFELWL